MSATRASRASRLFLDGSRRSLTKGPDPVLTGVCSGIAEHLDADAIIVRVTAVVLMVCTLGLVVIPYVALALTLPRPDEDDDPVEVDPLAVQSDRYHQVVAAHKQRMAAVFADHAARADAAYRPPRPPANVSEAWSAHRMYLAQLHAPAEERARRLRRSPLVFALALGMMILFAAAITFAVPNLPRASAWCFWPIFSVVIGTTLLVCYGDKWPLTSRLSFLVLCIEACLFLLPFTLGICPVISINRLEGPTILVWFAAILSLMAGLIFERPPLLVLAATLFAAAIVLSLIDMGAWDRYQALSTYARHNMAVPSFTR